tara:strand:- start:494 stop:1480 length:987 start_codon:yes stop_codon:yes gene_type:complete
VFSNYTFFLKTSLAVSLLFLFGITTLVVLLKPLELDKPLILEINKGKGLNQVIEVLSKKRIIKRPLILKIYSRIFFKGEIYAGEYLLSPDLNFKKILKKISIGDIYYRQIRLREGSTFKEILNLLNKNPSLSCDEEQLNQKRIADDLGIPYLYLEGLFYPDTYNFKKGDSCFSILQRSNKNYNLLLEELWESRNIGLPYKDPYEALILASLIEKEGIEKKQIAGVFIRRLHLKMKLQSDPTIIFALGDNYRGDIKRSHIKMKHPYNTYYIKGLPPSPIGLVSRSSIEAALNPTEGSFLYFVSKGDGTHFFSSTLEEHNRAVQKYQLNK